MKLKCISTGSKGNTYALISSVGEILLLDLGASEKEIKKALEFNISSIVGACATHMHGDHAKSIKDLENMGIRVFKPYEDNKHQNQIIKNKYGDFTVMAFALDDKNSKVWQHTNTDGSECPIYGFYITHPELDSPFIYATDCKLIKWNFAKQNPSTILLGVDYQPDMLDTDSAKYRHQVEGHMSIETACDFIKANNSSYLRNVLLGHLSNSSADDEYFINEVNKVCNSSVYVLDKGVETELSLPF